MQTTKELRSKLEQRKGQRLELQRNAKQLSKSIKINKRKLKHLEQAREIIKQVGLKTQKQLEFHIADIASLALESVFDKPYKLVLKFEERRNTIERDILFEKNNNQIDPQSEGGGGVNDVAAFALRIASYSMQVPKPNNIIVLDEPFKFINGKELQERASDMIRQVSKKLGIQFMVITNESDLTFHANKSFSVINRNGKSTVKIN
ncbi:MAG: hypothetical protein ACOC2U_00040 [bacterium]